MIHAVEQEGPSPEWTVAEPPAAAPEVNPVAQLFRIMRGRWLPATAVAALLGPALGVAGFLSGTELYQSQAILRVYPQESNILYQTGDGSVLKTFETFVKAETTYVASHPVMALAAERLRADFPEETRDMRVSDLVGSIEIRRSDSLIVMKTKSQEAEFARAKLAAVVDAYLERKDDTEANRAAVRLSRLQEREEELALRLQDIRARVLEVGGEFGIEALRKAHVEKVARIEELTARQAELRSTLASLEAETGASTADMANQEILRATLLDRALADLNFDKAKREAELETLLSRYAPDAAQVRDKRQQVAVLERALGDRREQIRLLGQTGALTDGGAESAEESTAEIRAVLNKVDGQLATAREEARVLNGKQVELSAFAEAEEETRSLLEETRKALEVIRLETDRALPGYTVVMSPPVRPDEPSEDSSKMLGAAGFAVGGVLAFGGALGLAIGNRRLRHSDDLGSCSHLAPVIRVGRRGADAATEADALRNALQLWPLRRPQAVGRARLIGVARLDRGAPSAMARDLAESFARARLQTLLVDADLASEALTRDLDLVGTPGWREALAAGCAPLSLPMGESLQLCPAGTGTETSDRSVGVKALREAVNMMAEGREVVVLHAGSLSESLSAELVLSVCDIAVIETRRGDRLSAIRPRIEAVAGLAAQGAGLVFTNARRADPGLPA